MNKCKECGQEIEVEVTQKIPAKTLVWGKTSPTAMTWQEAKDWCEAQGWDMPTRLELLQACEDKVEGFRPDDYFWSSTELSGDATSAWSVSLFYGTTYHDYKTYSRYVRACKRM